jgi:hypothetical protein
MQYWLPTKALFDRRGIEERLGSLSLVWTLPLLLFCLFVCFCYWGLNSGPAPWATLPDLFCDGFVWIGSRELFARAGFKSWSSELSLWVARIVGVSRLAGHCLCVPVLALVLKASGMSTLLFAETPGEGACGHNNCSKAPRPGVGQNGLSITPVSQILRTI